MKISIGDNRIFANVSNDRTVAEVEELTGYIDVYASAFGFSPLASATDNVTALQYAVKYGHKRVHIYEGTYHLNNTILLDSHTIIIGEGDVQLSRSAGYGCYFMNRGATEDKWNEDIELSNFNFVTNGLGIYNPIVERLNCHIGFYHIRDLNINNVQMLDGNNSLYFIYCCDFEAVRFTDIDIISLKDGINLACGHDGIYRRVNFGTYDDACALAGAAFPSHCLKIGDIYDISFIDCLDYTPPGQIVGGFFIRALVASWTDWNNGNTYKTGNYINANGNIYQCSNATGFSGIGTVEPSHTSGDVTGADGITWHYLQSQLTKNHTDIYNITLTNTTHNKVRSLFYANSYVGTYLEAVYPGTEDTPLVYNIIIDGSGIEPGGGAINIVTSDGALTDCIIRNCSITLVNYIHWNYNTTSVFNRNVDYTIDNNNINILGGYFRSKMDTENIYMHGIGNNMVNVAAVLYKGAGEPSTFRINCDTLKLQTSKFSGLTPVIGDRLNSQNGVYEYTAGGWILV